MRDDTLFRGPGEGGALRNILYVDVLEVDFRCRPTGTYFCPPLPPQQGHHSYGLPRSTSRKLEDQNEEENENKKEKKKERKEKKSTENRVKLYGKLRDN